MPTSDNVRGEQRSQPMAVDEGRSARFAAGQADHVAIAS
jgi:hypothetical protein